MVLDKQVTTYVEYFQMELFRFGISVLLLIGFGLLVYILRDLFAVLASIVFFFAGVGCGITVVKIFWTQRKLDKIASGEPQGYRENVRIHIEHHDE